MPSCRPAACSGVSCCAAAPKQSRLAPHELECPLQSNMASHRLRAWLKPRCHSDCLGQFASGGNQGPHHRAISGRKFHQAVTKAGMPSALVPQKACLRACGDWIRAPAACCTGSAADRRVLRAPTCLVAGVLELQRSQRSGRPATTPACLVSLSAGPTSRRGGQRNEQACAW